MTDGNFDAEYGATGAGTIFDQFPLYGLKVIAPNSGFVDHASFAYERQNAGVARQGYLEEEDGIYLRLVALEPVLTGGPIDPMRSTQHRIAPRVIPNVAGQFSIPARLDGAADARRTTVKIINVGYE